MTTEKNSHNDPKPFGELFRSFEAEPPPDTWSSIRARMAGEQPETSPSMVWSQLIEWIQPANRLYPVLTGIGVIVIAVFIWLSVNPSNHIKGHAFAGEYELTRGTAYLFRVHDKEPPFDSVRFVKKTELDSTGLFAFGQLPSGSYLLRVHVHPDSPHFPRYLHGYYGDQLHWNKAKLIQTDQPMEFYHVRLPEMISK